MVNPQSNRVIINGPASVERNLARLKRLALAEKKATTPERLASLQAEGARIRATLEEQRDAIAAALAAVDAEDHAAGSAAIAE